MTIENFKSSKTEQKQVSPVSKKDDWTFPSTKTAQTQQTVSNQQKPAPAPADINKKGPLFKGSSTNPFAKRPGTASAQQ